MNKKEREHILGVTNDVNEGTTKHIKKSELLDAVRYWSNQASELASDKESLRMRVLIFATDLYKEPDSAPTGEGREE